jgi:hypothetical protein
MPDTFYVWLSDGDTLGRYLDGWHTQVWWPSGQWADWEIKPTEGTKVSVPEARRRMREAPHYAAGASDADPFADAPVVIPSSSAIDAAVRALVETTDYVDRDTGDPLHGLDEFPEVADPEDDS